jgi:hypothetical protein
MSSLASYRIRCSWLVIGLMAMVLHLTSCSAMLSKATGGKTEATLIATYFPYSKEDGTLSLTLIPGMGETIAPGGSIALALRNHGKMPVVFETGFEAEGFIYSTEEETWVSVPNTVEYPPGRWLLGGKSSELSQLTVVDFGISKDANLDSDMIRIVVLGTQLLENDDLGDAVMAHIDVPVSED